MKKPFLLILAALLCAHFSFAQNRNSRNTPKEVPCPKVYIGFGTGINYSSGLIGLNIDVPVVGGLSLGTGVGLSSWGYKVYGEARYFFSPCNRGWAIGTGITLNTGLDNFQTDLPTTFGTRTVWLDLHNKTNAFVCGYRFWTMGKRNNRFHLQLGYSIPLSNDDYTVLYGDVLSDEGEAVMDILSPGGVIVGIGFTFGIGGR